MKSNTCNPAYVIATNTKPRNARTIAIDNIDATIVRVFCKSSALA